jgi:hypothetical protein
MVLLNLIGQRMVLAHTHVCNPRAAPHGGYGLKSGENGHLARANGANDGPYCPPIWPSVFGRRCEPLAGRGCVLGGGAAPAPAHAARGALLQFEWLRKTCGAQAVRAWPAIFQRPLRTPIARGLMTGVTMRSFSCEKAGGPPRGVPATLARGWDEAWRPKWRFAGFKDVAPTV